MDLIRLYLIGSYNLSIPRQLKLLTRFTSFLLLSPGLMKHGFDIGEHLTKEWADVNNFIFLLSNR